jgi:glycerol-3-phosphate dehydrogenase (NAD(P)+)
MARPAVAVVGGGAWGVALAAAAARTGGPTLLVSRRSLDGSLPPGVTLAEDDRGLGSKARLIVLAVPSSVAHAVARSLGAHLDGRHYVVHGVRGLVPVKAPLSSAGLPPPETISDVVRDETPVRRVGALGGPALASDLLAGRPTVMICASRYPEVNRAVMSAFGSSSLRLYGTADLAGLEWASALVACLAIAVGFARGVGLGPGLLAAFITVAVEEAARLTECAGGSERTVLGLGGYGDLLASIAQTERPEVVLGEALARGKTLAQALAEAGQRVEAVELAEVIASWAEARGLAAPILAALARQILPGRASAALVNDLMTAV